VRRQDPDIRGAAGLITATIDALRAARRARVTVVLATRLTDGAKWLLPDAGAPAEAAAFGAAASHAGRSRTGTLADGEWFFETHVPPPRLVIVGAVHIAQALAPLAAGLGFAVTVVDPRRTFATAERFPGVAVSCEWPDEAMDGLTPDATTAVVTLTHDPKLDDPALDRALRSAAFYVGALGSRKTHAARLDRLRALGHDDAALARVRGPAGLALGRGERAGDRAVDRGRTGRGAARRGVGRTRAEAMIGEEVAAIVLAAGRSSRVAPRRKLLLRGADGRAMVACVVDAALASRARPVLVVLGHRGDDVRAAIGDRAVEYAVAPDYAAGLSASLRAGLAAVPTSVGGALIMLGDMPLVDAATLDALVDAYDPADGRAIIQPTHDGRGGNPVLWDGQFFAAMQALDGDTGARHLLRRHADRVTKVEMPTDAVLRDFDTAESLPDWTDDAEH